MAKVNESGKDMNSLLSSISMQSLTFTVFIESKKATTLKLWHVQTINRQKKNVNYLH